VPVLPSVTVTGGGKILFADGTVRFLSNANPHMTLGLPCKRADNQVIRDRERPWAGKDLPADLRAGPARCSSPEDQRVW
jgi:hypothetical protein